MDRIEHISIFGRCPDIFEGVDVSAGASRGRPLGAVAWHQIVGIVNDLDNELKAVDEVTELTDEGKLKRKSRLVRDAEVRLTEANKHLDTLKKDVDEVSFKLTETDEAVMAAIWPRLPEDTLEVRQLHAQALEQGDFVTANAIENLPVAFAGRVEPEDLAVLKRDRMRAEAPEATQALEAAEDVLAVVTAAAQSAAGWLTEAGKGLPEPEATGQTTQDGLLFLSPSQLEEARA